MRKSFLFLTSVIFLMTGCIQQELILPSLPGQTTNNNREQHTSSIDVSDLNVAPISDNRVTRIPFPVDEYKRLSQIGEGTVKGVIYLTDASGNKIYGKQTRLYLNPVTSYSKQWYKESYIGGKKLTKADPRLFNYLKFTTSDANGRFTFYGVPSGRYYLIGVVRCAEQCGYDTSTNIRIAKEIEVDGKETVNVDLTKSL